MNHLTTEPIESTTEYESAVQHGSANAEEAMPKTTRTTFVPPLDPTVGIELRVTRAGIPARRLRINSTRCTFGSGEGCTVRLSDASLRPLHAVIVRDGGRIMIRGYSVPLDVNGQYVVESFLSLGDVVRLGEYCFELIDLPITDDDDRGYEAETVEASRTQTQLGASVEDPLRHEHLDRDSAMLDIAAEESPSTDGAPALNRFKFSRPAATSRKTVSRPSGGQSALGELRVSPVSVQICGGGDDLVVDDPAVREPITSLAQIHLHAKRNSELMADLAAARRCEQVARAKLVEAEAQIRRLNQQAEEKAKLLSRFETEADQARARIDELKDVRCGQAEQITHLSTALETSQSSELATATRLKSAVEQLQAELDASRQLVRNADWERVQLHALRSTLDSALREHLSEKSSWDAHLAGMNQKLEQVSIELKTTTEELSRSRSEAKSLQSQISEMRSLVANVQAELSLRPTVDHLQEVRSRLAQSESDCHNAEEQLAQLREDYDQLASQRVAAQSVAADPALQPSASAASLPMAVFPVPAVVDSTTEMMRAADEPLHTEPMNRFSGESFAVADSIQPLDDSRLAAMIQRSEETTSEGFTDCTAKCTGDDYTNGEDDDSFPGEMRRKEFDERVFRDSFSGPSGDDVIDSHADEAAYSVQSEPAQEPAYRSSTASPAVREDEEEDSVEAYMNQLLRRMGQDPSSASAVDEPVQPALSQFSRPKSGGATSAMPEVIRPGRTSPEMGVPLEQMRELANQSAESAISTSNLKGAMQLRSKALVDGSQAGVIVVSGLVFFYCGTRSSHLMLVWNTAGALALALSAFFFYEMVRKSIAASINRS